eukprot:6486900-Amphidinium_carterae.1
MHAQSRDVKDPGDDDKSGVDASVSTKIEHEDEDEEEGEGEVQAIETNKPYTLKSVNKNILAASRICASALSRRLFLLLCQLPVPVMDWFDNMLRSVKDPEQTAVMMRELSEGSLIRLMRSVAAWFVSREFAQILEFTETVKRGAASVTCEQVASSALTLFVNCVGEWSCTSASWSAELPGAFLRLLSDDSGARAEALEYLRRVWIALRNLEEECARKPVASTFHLELKWSTMEWVREMLIALAAHDWCLSDGVRESIMHYAHAWWSSLLPENTLRHARSKDGKPSGKSGMLRTYHHLCRGTSLASDYGRKGIVPDDVPHATGQHDLTDEFFEVDQEIMSLSQSSVDRLLENPPSYPRLSSRGVREAGIRTLCMVHCNGDMTRIDGCFWSKLLVPGNVVSLTSAVSGHLIFYSCRYGALGMKVGLAVRDKQPVLTGFFSASA